MVGWERSQRDETSGYAESIGGIRDVLVNMGGGVKDDKADARTGLTSLSLTNYLLYLFIFT